MEISILSEKANKPFVDKGDKPPYAGLRAQDITLKRETVFVRVHGAPASASKPQGRWVMRKKDIEGLTARQIKDKFALPELPAQISDVYAPAGTRLTVGKTAAQKGWGLGGGTQYELMTRLPDSAFRNTRPLK